MKREQIRRYVRHARDVARQHREQAADESRPASQRLLAIELAEQAERNAAQAERLMEAAQ